MCIRDRAYGTNRVPYLHGVGWYKPPRYKRHALWYKSALAWYKPCAVLTACGTNEQAERGEERRGEREGLEEAERYWSSAEIKEIRPCYGSKCTEKMV
eukprot:1949253-Rhodomonas_salina.3